MGTPALGKLNLKLESLSLGGGEQVLMPPTVIGASQSLTNQPNLPSRLYLSLWGNTATGTITLTGKDQNGNALGETIPPTGLIPVAPSGALEGQSSQVADYEYVSMNTYASINANGITATGLGSPIAEIWGITGDLSGYALPAVLDADKKIGQKSPNENRGIAYAHTRILQTVVSAEVSKLEQDFYPSQIWPLAMGVSSDPALSTIPATPASLLAATLITSLSNVTTQPSAPGQILQLVVTGASAKGTITVTGTINGVSGQQEVVSMSGNGTYNTLNVFSAVSALSGTGLTGGSLAVGGYFVETMDFKLDGSALYSAVMEWFTGTDSRVYPLTIASEITLDGKADGEVMWSLKGESQDELPIGDRTTAPMLASRITNLSEPMEIAMAGWQVFVYVDPITGTPGTTQFYDLLDYKIIIKPNQLLKHTATNRQQPNRVWRKKGEVTFEATVDLTNIVEKEQFRTGQRRWWYLLFQGPIVGISGGVPVYEQWAFYLPLVYETWKDDAGPDKEAVTGKLTARCEYNTAAGYPFRCTVQAQQSPSYLTA
jgi:hypothetical protein